MEVNMSLTVRLYNFQKKPNSTARPSGGDTYDCELKSPCSLMNPVLLMKGNMENYNYCRIADFHRYYFIQDIVFNEGLWELHCNVDVLASYKDTIGSTNCYITRSSVNYDGTIIDSLYPARTQCTISNVQDAWNFGWTGFEDGYYILGLQGTQGSNSNGVLYYQLSPADFVSVISGFYSNTGTTWWGNLVDGVINALNKMSDFVVSCTWMPIKLNEETATHRVFVGSYNTGVDAHRVDAYPANNLGIEFTVPKHPQASSRGSYLNYPPYARYELIDPLVGTVPLNPNVMRDISTLKVSLDIDHTTAQACYMVYHVVTGVGVVPIYTTYIPFGCNISLNGSVVNVASTLGSAAQTAASIASGDFLGALNGIGNALLSSIPSMGSHGANGGFVSFVNNTATLKGYFMPVVNADNANRGRPWCQIAQPANVGGYMVIENPHVAIDGTEDEASMLNGMLSSGIYYE